MRKKNDNRIKIQIIGPSHVGKSTVAQIIAQALHNAGLNVDSYNSDIPQMVFVDQELQEFRINAIRDLNVDLEEVVTRPNPFTESLV